MQVVIVFASLDLSIFFFSSRHLCLVHRYTWNGSLEEKEIERFLRLPGPFGKLAAVKPTNCFACKLPAFPRLNPRSRPRFALDSFERRIRRHGDRKEREEKKEEKKVNITHWSIEQLTVIGGEK